VEPDRRQVRRARNESESRSAQHVEALHRFAVKQHPGREGTALDAACRIVILEDQLEEARRINAELNQRGRASELTVVTASDTS
jgi:hypothetical protein